MVYYHLFGLKKKISLQNMQAKWQARSRHFCRSEVKLQLTERGTSNNWTQHAPTCQPNILYHTLNKSSCSMLCLLTLYLWSAGEGWPPTDDTSSKLSGDRSLLGSPSTLRRSVTFIWAVAWPIGSPSWKQAAIRQTRGFHCGDFSDMAPRSHIKRWHFWQRWDHSSKML
jgi:hypothetical protein